MLPKCAIEMNDGFYITVYYYCTKSRAQVGDECDDNEWLQDYVWSEDALTAIVTSLWRVYKLTPTAVHYWWLQRSAMGQSAWRRNRPTSIPSVYYEKYDELVIEKRVEENIQNDRLV